MATSWTHSTSGAETSAAQEQRGPVAVLQHEVANGEADLGFEPAHGYLLALLQRLHVPLSSQVLVFSKTSSQRRLISPQTPRALYFNDDVYVGWVPQGDVIEISEADNENGAVFYTLNQTRLPLPAVQRREDCLQCHDGVKTMGGPGHLMGSMFTAPDGQPLFPVEGYMGGHRSPLCVRWGGWYVTGSHSGEVHLGNAVLKDRARPESLDLSAGANVTDLRERCAISLYASPHSDIVALLVLEHQVRMHNLISRLNREARDAQTDPSLHRKVSAAPAPGPASPLRQDIARAAEALLEYMLLRDEAPLKGLVRGTSRFAEEFQENGPRDSKGRSLRTLDLEHRLFRYPCSYLIYTKSFDALPGEVKNYLWRRLWEILANADRTGAYAAMTSTDRQSIWEILNDTKPEFADWLHENTAASDRLDRDSPAATSVEMERR